MSFRRLQREKGVTQVAVVMVLFDDDLQNLHTLLNLFDTSTKGLLLLTLTDLEFGWVFKPLMEFYGVAKIEWTRFPCGRVAYSNHNIRLKVFKVIPGFAR